LFGYSSIPKNTQNDIVINQSTNTNKISNPILNNPVVNNIVNIVTSLPIIRQTYTAGKYIYEKVSSIDWGKVWERFNNPELYTPTGEKAKVVSFTMPLIGPTSASGALNVISTSEKITKAGNILRSTSLYTPVIKDFVKESAKNTFIVAAVNLGANEAISYLTTGKHLTWEQAGKIATESVVFGTTFTAIGKGFSMASQPILSTIIKPQTSANVAILSKSLYDVGSVYTSTFGADIATQAFSKSMGWKDNINVEEALATASLASGFTAGIKGLQVLKAAKTGDFSPFATKIVPEDIKSVQVTPISVTNDNYITTFISGRAVGNPAIGQRILTKTDVPNLKQLEYDFLITPRVKIIDIFYKTENNIPKTYITYEGEYITQVGSKKIIGKIEGETESVFILNPNIDFKKYQMLQQYFLKHYSRQFPEFVELQNVPKEGLKLSKDILEGALIRTLDNPFIERLNIYYPISELKVGNVNFNKNIAGILWLESKGKVNLPSNEGYKFRKEGIGLIYYLDDGGKNQLSQLVTTYGVARDQYKKDGMILAYMLLQDRLKKVLAHLVIIEL